MSELTPEKLQAAIDCLVEAGEPGPYVAFVHPDRYRKLVEIVARDRWKRAYRAYRRELHEAKVTPNWPAHAILSGYDDTDELIRGEVGQVDGFTIKETPVLGGSS